jgi:hypothetical protein
MRQFCVLLTAMLATAAAPAPAAAPQAPRQCFWASEVSGFSDAGPSRALVRVGARETWELTLAAGCPHVDWAMRIGIRSRTGERICPGRPAELLVPNASESGFQRCLVSGIRKLTPSEARAARGEH